VTTRRRAVARRRAYESGGFALQPFELYVTVDDVGVISRSTSTWFPDETDMIPPTNEFTNGSFANEHARSWWSRRRPRRATWGTRGTRTA
jgi:hypothetical protein